MHWSVAPHETIAAVSATASRLRRLPLPLALMALIFFFSSQSDLGTDLGLIDLIGRKIAHATIYACLTIAWWWALATDRERGERWPIGVAALIAFIYAISDEYHQTFVEGRVGSPIDVGIDSLGILFAVWIILTGRVDELVNNGRRLRGRLRSGRGGGSG